MRKNVFESKFNVLRVSNPLTKTQMKGYKGGYETGAGYGGYDGGDKACWRKCYYYNGNEFPASVYAKSCYDNYHVCTDMGLIADCECIWYI